MAGNRIRLTSRSGSFFYFDPLGGVASFAAIFGSLFRLDKIGDTICISQFQAVLEWAELGNLVLCLPLT